MIERAQGVQLTLAQAQRHPANPLTIDGEHVWCQGNLHFIVNREPRDGTYWGWYCQRVPDPGGSGPDEWHAQLVPVRSDDGLRWRTAGQPVSPGKERTIIHEPDEPDPARRFKSVFQRLMQRNAQGELIAVSRTEMRQREAAGQRGTRQMVSSWSADGQTWAEPHVVVSSTEHPEHRWWRVGDPGWDGSDNFPCLIWSPELGESGKYVAFFRTNIYNGPGERRERGVGRAESADFARWSPHELALHANVPRHRALGYSIHDYYQLQIWRHGSGIYLGIVSVFYWGEDRNHLELVWSPDTVHWEHLCPGTDIVPHGALGEYDGGCRYAAMRPITHSPDGSPVGDEVRVYYGGSTGRHNTDRVGDSAVCLAIFRRDRFAGYRAAGPEPGVILTRPFELRTGALSLNVDAAGGEVRAELCDESGAPLSGFAKDDAAPITTDSLAAAVTWRGDRQLAQLGGRMVRLRLYVNRAAVYALDLAS